MHREDGHQITAGNKCDFVIRKSKDYVYGIWVYKALGIWKSYNRVIISAGVIACQLASNCFKYYNLWYDVTFAWCYWEKNSKFNVFPFLPASAASVSDNFSSPHGDSRWGHGKWLEVTVLTTHASTPPAVRAANHHSQNAYLTAIFGHYIGGYFNN